jgi:predicted amidohydrolase
VLPLVTSNTARVLKLPNKGTLDMGKDADVWVLRKDSLEIVEVIAGGRRLVARGGLNVEERVSGKEHQKCFGAGKETRT